MLINARDKKLQCLYSGVSGVRIGDTLKVIGTLSSSVVDGWNVIRNYQVGVLSEVHLRYIDYLEVMRNLSEW